MRFSLWYEFERIFFYTYRFIKFGKEIENEASRTTVMVVL